MRLFLVAALLCALASVTGVLMLTGAQDAPQSTDSGNGGGPIIMSTSGTLTHGSTLTINGSGFRTHADYGGRESFIARAYNDFSVALEDGNWEFDGTPMPEPDNLTLQTSRALGGAATQYYRKRNVNDDPEERQGSVTVRTVANTGIWYHRFYYRESPLDTLGLGDGTKFWRHYFGTAPRDWYLGPNFENTTAASSLYEVGGKYSGRYSGTAAFGGTANFLRLTEDKWIIYEITECTRRCAPIFGSDDYIEIYASVPGVGRERLMRRGGDLPSKRIAAEGTDADESDKWIDDDLGPRDANGHTAGDLGSLFGAARGGSGGYMDFAEAYQDYTLARVVVCNAPTLDDCDTSHIQIPLSWSPTQITVTLNRGQWASFAGKYLIVVTENNDVSAGFAL